MFKVLIADSDWESIRNFKTYIKTYAPEIKNIRSTADSSRNILDQIEGYGATLIIADIRFFGMRGYTAIKDIHEKFPEISIILYGTHADSEYMKQAMDFGVVDYAFRPVKPLEFQRCIETAIAKQSENEKKKKEEERLIAGYNSRFSSFEDIFLINLVDGNIRNEAEVQRSFRYFQMDFKKGYCVFILRIDHFSKVILTLDEMEKHLLIYKILAIVQKKLGNQGGKAFIPSFNSVVAIVDGDNLENIMNSCEAIKEAVYMETKIRTTIGIGRMYTRASDISVSYKEAEAALRYRFHMGYGTVIPIHFVEPVNSITYRYPIEKEKKLVYTAAIGEYEYCMVLLKDLFDALKESEPLPDKLLSKIIMDILISINRYVSEMGLPMHSRFTTFFSSKAILEFDNIDEAYAYLSNALKNFCEFIVEMQGQNNERLYKEAKDYIDERYYETFSLSKIAMNLGTTMEYLNRVFHAKEGKSVFDYVVAVRINEAKRLMRETKHDDDLIAVKVGYEDGRYFRSVFRQVEGTSVKEYRTKFSLFSPALNTIMQG